MSNISNNNLDLLIQSQIKNCNNLTNYNANIDNLTNEFSKSMGSNNNKLYMNKINMSISNTNHDHNNNYSENLRKELINKNKMIENYAKKLNEYKGKIDMLLARNKKIIEESKKNQDFLMGQIKEYQSEIYNLKKTNYDLIKRKKNSNNNRVNSLNDSYKNLVYNDINNNKDYIRQINELRNQIEKYKIENNNLKILLIKAKNNSNNYSKNSNEPWKKDNSRNRFSLNNGNEKKYDKKSYSVSKSKKRMRMSIFLKKNYEEDLPSENNNVKSFVLN